MRTARTRARTPVLEGSFPKLRSLFEPRGLSSGFDGCADVNSSCCFPANSLENLGVLSISTLQSIPVPVGAVQGPSPPRSIPACALSRCVSARGGTR